MQRALRLSYSLWFSLVPFALDGRLLQTAGLFQRAAALELNRTMINTVYTKWQLLSFRRS
jgi:hypothetical protein